MECLVGLVFVSLVLAWLLSPFRYRQGGPSSEPIRTPAHPDFPIGGAECKLHGCGLPRNSTGYCAEHRPIHNYYGEDM